MARRRSSSSTGGGSAVQITVTPDLHKLAKELRAADRKAEAAMKRRMREVAEPIRARVAAEASWSTRIPQATKVSTRFTAKTQNVIVTVNRRQAPHARPLENDGKAGAFTHPVFGRGRVAQQARPFFEKAIKSQDHRIDAAILDIAREYERELGFE